jgi:outer membrane lipoprotein-sorting protein
MRAGRQRVALVIALGAALSVVPAWAEGTAEPNETWGITQLMRGLAQVKSASGQFIERKTLHMLNEPLVSSGTLLYVAPDQVQKITVSPQRERFALSGDRLTMEGVSEGSRTLSLLDYPEVGAFVAGIRATLAGDLPALHRFYAVDLKGSATDWQLILQPTEPKLQQLVKSIRIVGNGNRIRTVETEERDGDRSEMSIAEDVR